MQLGRSARGSSSYSLVALLGSPQGGALLGDDRSWKRGRREMESSMQPGQSHLSSGTAQSGSTKQCWWNASPQVPSQITMSFPGASSSEAQAAQATAQSWNLCARSFVKDARSCPIVPVVE